MWLCKRDLSKECKGNYKDCTDCILDKIKAEIDQKQYDFMSDGDYNEGVMFGLMLAYQIIDKYKAETKEKQVERGDWEKGGGINE